MSRSPDTHYPAAPVAVKQQDDLFAHSFTAQQQVEDLRAAGAHVFGIQERFERFHRQHPEVYDSLLTMARGWHRANGGRWSVDAAFHVMRFERVMAGLPDQAEVFKLNNNYTARYARLLIRRNPELADLFETRELKS